VIAPEASIERRKPARGWRGWRGPTEQKPFPSLGWLFLDWTYAFLPAPDDETRPLVYTDEQARRIVRWFEVHPITGEFIYDRLDLEEAKGWGKSPFAGTLDIGELAGPVCFDGWDADGEPVGAPWGTGGRMVPWIQIAALSEDQTQNTYGALYGMLAARDGKVADNLRLDLGRTKVYHRDMPAAILEPVTTSAGSRTGQRITKVTIDETWLLTQQNGGTRLVSTVRFNLSKTNGREVDTTNAPTIGGGSVAEQSKPDAPAAGVLHYITRPSREPRPDDTDEVLLELLAETYRDVPWINLRRQLKTVRDPETKWEDALRLLFNWRSSAAAAAMDPRIWSALSLPREVPAGTEIGIGFDGSTHWDATVLRASTRWGYTFILGRWSRPPAVDEWQVPRAEVEQCLADAFARYRVGRVLADPPGWVTELDRWAAKWGEDVVLAFDTGQPKRMALAVDRWLTTVRAAAGRLRSWDQVGPLELPYSHDGDEFTTGQVLATKLRRVRLAELPTDRSMYMLEKDGHFGSDSLVADVLALEAAMTMPAIAEPVKPWVRVRR
jgi:hypothetical protein